MKLISLAVIRVMSETSLATVVAVAIVLNVLPFTQASKVSHIAAT